MLHWIDAHNHLQDPRLGDPAPVISAMRAAGVGRCIVNSTREDDWPAVAALAQTRPEMVTPAYGIHPWHAHTAGDGWVERLGELLASQPLALLGECGLDGWVSAPALAVQRKVFLAQLGLARELRRPMTIHCLKAWGPLLECLEECRPPRFLMHSYGGSPETARRLLPLGAWFSFSGYFLHPRKAAVVEVFRQLPHERILLETDAPDMTPPAEIITHPLPDGHNHPANLPAIGRAFAAALGMDVEELAALTSRNAAEFGTGC
jgi:TatD DNase family protein